MTRLPLAVAAVTLMLAAPALADPPASGPSMPLGVVPHHVITPLHRQHAARPVDRAAMRATAALNLLEAQGYAAFSDFHQAGANFTATVTPRNGTPFTVIIDPDGGQVTRQG